MRSVQVVVIPSGTVASMDVVPSAATVIPADRMNRMSVVVTVAATNGWTPVAGNLTIQFSNDKKTGQNATNFAPTNWATLTTLAVSGAGTVGIGSQDLCAQWVRVTWTHTAGAGGTIVGTAMLMGWGGQ